MGEPPRSIQTDFSELLRRSRGSRRRLLLLLYLLVMVLVLRGALVRLSGLGSLLVLVGLGEGFRSGQHRQLSTFGNDLVMMWNGTIPALANQHTGMRPYQLTLGDEAELRTLPQLRAVTAFLNRNDLYQVSAYANTSGQVLGVEPNYTEVRFVPVAEGRFLSADDIAQGRRVAVLGSKSATLLFPGRPMLGETITINDVAFTVVGRVASISRGNNDG